MQIRLASIMFDDQDKALRFYTTILGFVKNKDIPMGPFRWLTRLLAHRLVSRGLHPSQADAIA
jgi:catechol 2,3-dioxygenase-like lactoylglutathione lyase family enzyme